MRKDLRNAERAIPEELVQLAIKLASGATFFADVLEINGQGADLRFARESAPSLPLGQHATLAFRSPRFQKPVEIKAVAFSRIESEAARGYGFRFERTPELEATLQSIFSLVNQRHAHRVRPRMTESIAVILGFAPGEEASVPRAGVRSAKGLLRDISLSGLGLAVPAEVEISFANVEIVSVAPQLPGASGSLPLVGWIRNRRFDERQVTYGIEFDAERSEDYDARHKEIVEYVMRRQREQLRVRAAGRS